MEATQGPKAPWKTRKMVTKQLLETYLSCA